MENNVFPRALLLITETQLLTKAGLSDDETKLRQAEQQIETILSDPSIAHISTVQDTATKVREAISRSERGMTKEETKIFKHGMTEIKPKD